MLEARIYVGLRDKDSHEQCFANCFNEVTEAIRYVREGGLNNAESADETI